MVSVSPLIGEIISANAFQMRRLAVYLQIVSILKLLAALFANHHFVAAGLSEVVEKWC